MLIELHNRVLEVTVTPGREVPGRCRRTLTAEVISGPPLTDEEWKRASAAVVAELISAGCEVYGWEAFGPDGPAG